MSLLRGFFVSLVLVLLLCFGCVAATANPRLLVDMASGEVLFDEEAGQAWHPASLTKLMTAYVVFKAVSSGRVRLDTPVIISARALREPPSKVGLPVDTALTLEDALYLLIVKSANDIAVALAETVSGSVEAFIVEMNLNANALGLSATHYVNPNGLHDPEQTTSARDLAVLALAIRTNYPQYAGIFATEIVRLGKARLQSQNNLLRQLVGTTGMKTGFVCASGLNIVATAERDGRSLMAIVLGGSSARERGELTAELLKRGMAGDLPGTGKQLADLGNSRMPPRDMRSEICGKEAKAYVAARAKAYPYGLEGQPSFLSDTVAPREHRVATLGQLRNVPLPHPRPLWAPSVLIGLAADPGSEVPLPRPRPFLRPGL